MNFKLIFFIFLIFSLTNSHYLFAQGGLVSKNCIAQSQNCTLADFIEAVQRAIRFMLILGYWIAALVAIIGAFMTMFGGVTKDWLGKGKAMMINSITYYFLLLLAGIIFDLVLDFLKPKIYTGY